MSAQSGFNEMRALTWQWRGLEHLHMPAHPLCWLVQLQVYMPGRANPDYGVVRTVVKDATDAWFNGDPVQALVYLDTDGQVNNNGSSKPLNDVSSPCPQAPPR